MDKFLVYLGKVRHHNPVLVEAVEQAYTEIKNQSDAFDAAVRKAIVALKQNVPDYYQTTLGMRLADGTGSVTDYTTFNDLDDRLMSAHWEPYESENIGEECWCAKTYDIPGHLGVVSLDSLDPRTPVVLDNSKGNGYLSAVVKSDHRAPVDYSVMVIGKNNGEDVMYTFYPGDPMESSTFKEGTDELYAGDVISAQDAIEHGFTFAKIV